MANVIMWIAAMMMGHCCPSIWIDATDVRSPVAKQYSIQLTMIYDVRPRNGRFWIRVPRPPPHEIPEKVNAINIDV